MTRLRNGIILETMCEDLTDFYADAIVLPNSCMLDWESDLIDRVARKAGKTTLATVKKNTPIPPGEAIVTIGGGLLATYIVHVAIFPFEETLAHFDKEGLLTGAIQNVLMRCAEIELESIGTPNLGAYLGFSPQDSARLLIASINDWAIPSDNALKKVFCVFGDEEESHVFAEIVSTLSS